MTGERDSWSSFWAIRSDESAIAVWIGARLAGTKLTLLSSRSTTSWTADSKYLFPAELFFSWREDLSVRCGARDE
jgi:hypothetical protein